MLQRHFWKTREMNVMRDAVMRNLKKELCSCFSDSLKANDHAHHCEFYKRLKQPDG